MTSPVSETAAPPRRAALSPSRAGDFMQCPLLYRFRVVDRLPEAPSPAASRGTLVHAVLERLFDLPAGQRDPQTARELIEPQWRRLVQENPDLGDLVDEDDLADWVADAFRLVQRWFEMEDPTRLEPAARELYVEADVDGLTLRGYVDRLDVAPGGQVRVVDYKTGRSPSELFEGKALFQMKFYALVWWRTRGVIPAMLQLVYLGNGEIIRYEPSEWDLLATERKVKALWQAIERAATTGDWRPRPSRLCDWCDHKALCPAWGGTPPPLPDYSIERATDPEITGAIDPD
ncbi:RecB family exonuclease [Branchiibius cervicis]|uniref:RecB family exonuclease n=1 Tax=Branchiibius cervicis TaxID=908252 RepID=A0ABW2ASW2_9MICO